MKFDFPSFSGGVRTAGALLMGNSVLVYTGVLGSALADAHIIAAKIFTIGLIGLVIASVTRGSK
jgi:hypothetical protein